MTISEIIKKIDSEKQAVMIRFRGTDEQKNLQYDVKELFSGKSRGWTALDGFTASAMLKVYNQMGEGNRSKYDRVALNKLITFTWRYIA